MTTSRSERMFLFILALITLSGLALYAFAPHSPISHAGQNALDGQLAQEPSLGKQDSLIKDPHYVGPPMGQGKTVEKYKRYVSLDLNGVDSLTLLRVPGIGPAFAHRILALRTRLGGYYTVLQLQEVYGMDEDKFLSLRPWFVIKTPPKRHPLTHLRADSLPWHPYLSREQSNALRKLILRHGARLSWSVLRAEGHFSREDSIRLCPYFVNGPRTTETSSTHSDTILNQP